MSIVGNVSVTGCDSASYVPKAPWTIEGTTKETVNQVLVRKFREIISDYNERRERKTNSDLGRGPWYANEYAALLINRNQQKRHEFFLGKGHYFHGFPPKFFNSVRKIDSPTGIEMFKYKLKQDAKPSEALAAIKMGPVSFIDCSEAVFIAMYETIQEVLGEEKFDELFSSKGATPLVIDPAFHRTALHQLGFIHEEVITTEPQFGDVVHFGNLPLYSVKHPNGEEAGYNAICISQEDEEKKYLAFGLASEGASEEEVNQNLLDAFNKEPIVPTSILTQRLASYFENQSLPVKHQIFQATGKVVDKMTATMTEFKQVESQTALDRINKVGLKSIVKRLTVEAFHRYLPS